MDKVKIMDALSSSSGAVLGRTTRAPASLCTRRAPSIGVARSHRRLCVVASANTTQAVKRSVWLASRAAESALQLEVLPQGKGQVIVVSRVEPGSEAAQAGIKRGQMLVGISDPIRNSEVWDLGERPSLRFVRDALKLRRTGEIQLVVQDLAELSSTHQTCTQDFLNTSDPSWAASPFVAPRPSGPTLVPEQRTRGQQLPLPSPTGSFASDDEDGAGSSSSSTIGERMAAEFAAREAVTKVSEVNKRIARRSAYMDEVSQRNDSPFFAWLAFAFIGPAAIILGVAAATGYLDTLYTSSLTLH